MGGDAGPDGRLNAMTQYRPAHYRPEDLIDLARYPLDAPEGAPYRELVRAGR